MKFYATLCAEDVGRYVPPGVPVMLTASSFGRDKYRRRDGSLRPPPLPAHVTERAADCGGFVATRKWGGYRYSTLEYVQWLETWLTGPSAWAATMDYCCEREIAETAGIVRERQKRTTEMAYHFWHNHKGAPWVWVPTVQGWETEDYARHAEELSPLITEMRAYYGRDSAFRVGVGTLCQREGEEVILPIVGAVHRALAGVPLHLWGVKQTALAGGGECTREVMEALLSVASVDSAAWNGRFGTGLEESRRSDLSNREYAMTVALPAYLRNFYRATGKPRQITI